MNNNESQIMSSDVSMMVSDAMAASMGVLVVIISLLMLNVRDEYEQKLLEMDMVQTEQAGTTSDKSDVTNILLVNETYTINTMQGSKTYTTTGDFERAVRSLPEQNISAFVIYAEGITPFQNVINITDILTMNHPNVSIDIGAIDK